MGKSPNASGVCLCLYVLVAEVCLHVCDNAMIEGYEAIARHYDAAK